AMLGRLGEAGVIHGYRAVDIDPDALDEPGLILGVDLPGSHAVVTVPAGCAASLRVPLLSCVTRHSARPPGGLMVPEPAHWLSWGTAWDPAAEFPDSSVGEAWRLW
nr:hypothetical protein [Actinomycetota bacterium]